MKKKNKRKLPQYEFGTYVENPYSDLVENEIALVKAKNKASKNGCVKGLNIEGNLAMQYGTSMMNSEGAATTTPSGEPASTSGFAGKLNSFGANNQNLLGGLLGGLQGIGNTGYHAMGGIAGYDDIFSILLGGNDFENTDPGFNIGPKDNRKQLLQNWLLTQELSKASKNNNSNLQFATGGKVGIPTPIEAEGEEVIETPNGDVSQLKGPSHSEGGIDMVVPSGSEIFSKKLKGADGKSMAERKIDREKKEAKVEKLLKDSPTDMTLKKTLQRTKANNEKVEQTDMMKMQFAKMMADMVQHYALGGVVKYGGGGFVEDEDPTNPFNFLNEMFTNKGILKDNIYGGYGKTKPKLATPSYMPGNSKEWDLDNNGVSDLVQKPEGNPIVDQTQSNKTAGESTGKYDWLNSITGSMTAGDMTGLFGQLYSTFKPMENTRANRAGDTPNINPFLNYGKDALAKMDQSKEYIKQIRDEQNKDLELSRTSAIKRGRNSARGVNTLRALDLATDANANNTKSQIFNQFAQAMQQIYDKEATLENEQDFRVMEGEYKRDENDRKDRDAFFEQMAQDIATKGAGLQHIGKSFNQIKSRNVTNEILSGMYNDFELDAMTGKVKKKIIESLSNNATFYSSIKDESTIKKIASKVGNEDWVIVGSTVIDIKTGKPIDLTKINETE